MCVCVADFSGWMGISIHFHAMVPEFKEENQQRKKTNNVKLTSAQFPRCIILFPDILPGKKAP